jgi:hypothetical protein
MVRRQGRLIRQHRAPVEIEFSEESPIQPAFLELYGLAEPLDRNELVVIERDDGRIYNCRVLGSTPTICLVIEIRIVDPRAQHDELGH